MDARDEQVTDAGDSILRFEEWLETGDETLLDRSRRTTRSTASRRSSCTAGCSSVARRPRRPSALRSLARAARAARPSPEAAEAQDEVAPLADALDHGLAEDLRPEARGARAVADGAAAAVPPPRGQARVVGVLQRLEMRGEELLEDEEAIGQITADRASRRLPDSRSFIYTLRFREQEHKLLPGASPSMRQPSDQSTSWRSTTATGIVRIRRAQSRHGEPLPAGLIPGGPTARSSSAPRCGASRPQSSPPGSTAPARCGRCATCCVACHRGSQGTASGAALQDGSPDIEQLRRLAEQLEAPTCSSRAHPGRARHGQEPSSSSHLHRSGAPRRHVRDQPQGDPQPPPRDRGSRRRAAAELPGLEEELGRQPRVRVSLEARALVHHERAGPAGVPAAGRRSAARGHGVAVRAREHGRHARLPDH